MLFGCFVQTGETLFEFFQWLDRLLGYGYCSPINLGVEGPPFPWPFP